MNTPAPGEPAVVAAGVTRRFGEVPALDDVSFTVAPGEIFGFLGPDGAGKTTLLRILATLLVPDAGSARVLGRDTVRDLWALRARLGYMPGRFSLYPDLSVEENLHFFASVFGTTVEAGYALIEPIYRQLEPFRGRRAAALSGGMKQKLALCCALVHRPELLLLDEPTTGVDAVSRREFWELLGELRAGGLTILVSTPYMDEAGRCDRVALIQHGRILDLDAPERITARYPLPLVAVRAADQYRALPLLRAFPHARSVYPFGAELHYTDARAGADPHAIATELGEYLRAHDAADVEIEPIAAGIEDSFMLRMGAPEGAAAP
jgi:ABC-type multidrug transport system ATPase subunit